MGNAIQVERHGDHAICVYYDTDSESPREDENLGKLYLMTSSVWNMECTEDEMKNAPVRLPVYKYEHSGIALSTSNASYPFNCQWDACLAGYIVATRDSIYEQCGWKYITKNRRKKVEEILKAEIETYSQWLNGEVYGFKVFSGVANVADDAIEEEGKDEDQCWGFYSIKDALEDARLALPENEMAVA